MTHHYPVPWGKLGWSGTTNQEHYPDLGSDASSVGNFLHSFLGHHFVGKPVVAMKMLAVLSGYANSCAFSLSLFTSLLACFMIQIIRSSCTIQCSKFSDPVYNTISHVINLEIPVESFINSVLNNLKHPQLLCFPKCSMWALLTLSFHNLYVKIWKKQFSSLIKITNLTLKNIQAKRSIQINK